MFELRNKNILCKVVTNYNMSSVSLTLTIQFSEQKVQICLKFQGFYFKI